MNTKAKKDPEQEMETLYELGRDILKNSVNKNSDVQAAGAFNPELFAANPRDVNVALRNILLDQAQIANSEYHQFDHEYDYTSDWQLVLTKKRTNGVPENTLTLAKLQRNSLFPFDLQAVMCVFEIYQDRQVTWHNVCDDVTDVLFITF